MSIIKTERSLAYIHRLTHRRYVILTTLFAFCAQQLFFLHRQYVCIYVCEDERRRRRKKRRIFVLLKELACTHLMFECMYVCGRKKRACVWPRSDSDNVTKVRKEKKRRKSLVLVATGIGCMMWWFLFALAYILCPFDKASHTYLYIYEQNKQT